MTKNKSNKPKQKTNVSAVKDKTEIVINNSFCLCLSNITGIPEKFFPTTSISLVDNPDDWYSPYVKILKENAFDMIFYRYENPVEAPLEKWMWDGLPYGKCVILGTDANDNFKCIVGLMNDNKKLSTIYDPVPEAALKEIVQVGFFINSFVCLPPQVTENNGSS